MELITTYEIIKLRDKIPLNDLRNITNECKKNFGYVGYRKIFQTMGYVHAFNDKWHNI